MPRVIPQPLQYGSRKGNLPQNNYTLSGQVADSLGRWVALNFLNDVRCTGKTGNPLVEGQVLTFSGGSWINYFASATTGYDGTTSFTVAGDNGTPFTITSGETLQFVGQTGIDIGVADPEVRIAMDYNGADSFIMAATNGTSITVDGANDKLVIYDNDTALVKYINANQLPCCSKYWSADTTNIIRPTGDTTGVNIGGVLNVTGKTRTKGNLTTENYFTVGKDVGVSGATHLKENLFISGDTRIPDGKKIILGTGADTEIQQTGSETIIKDASTGNIKLRAGTVSIQNGAANKTMGVFNGANKVELFYNNDSKFETTNTGVNVAGRSKSTNGFTGNTMLLGGNVGDVLGVTGDTMLGGNLVVSNTLRVNASKYGSTIGLSGSTHLKKNLSVSGNTEISGNTALGGLSGFSKGTLSVVDSFGNDYGTWRSDFGVGQGSGEIIKFGTYGSAVDTPGQLVILKNNSGVPGWVKADARNPSTYYIENMIGVTLDSYDGSNTSKTATVLLKGYVRIPSSLWNGTAANATTGKQVYVSPDTNGEWTDEVADFDTTNDVMRGMGYCLQYEATSPASYFVYFNPDGNYIKITV